MSFLLSTLRLWNVMLEPRALRKPGQLKDTSVRLAPITPPMIGTSESST